MALEFLLLLGSMNESRTFFIDNIYTATNFDNKDFLMLPWIFENRQVTPCMISKNQRILSHMSRVVYFKRFGFGV